MEKLLSKYREPIKKEIHEFFDKRIKELEKTNRWGPDVGSKFKEFILNGKLIRGSLVLYFYEMFKGNIDTNAVKTAAAIEIIHSSLLIHDDIMDESIMRRNKKSTYIEYNDLAIKEQLKSPLHFGESMAICVGDIGFFFAFEILASLDIKPEIKKRISDWMTIELANVGLAQMQDVYLGHTKHGFTEKDLLDMYKYKTARYTFSLPMMLGAELAEQSGDILCWFELLGELMGTIYQVRDDELSIFGSEADVGKTSTSDIIQEKKTLYYYYLFNETDEDTKKKLKQIFGNPEVNANDMQVLRNIIEKSGIEKKVKKIIESLTAESMKVINQLEIDEKHKQILMGMLEYCSKRQK